MSIISYILHEMRIPHFYADCKDNKNNALKLLFSEKKFLKYKTFGIIPHIIQFVLTLYE